MVLIVLPNKSQNSYMGRIALASCVVPLSFLIFQLYLGSDHYWFLYSYLGVIFASISFVASCVALARFFSKKYRFNIYERISSIISAFLALMIIMSCVFLVMHKSVILYM
jgi:hypothetical protein